MAANYGETAIKTITVEKSRLVETLKSNLETHRREYGEAVEGFYDAQNKAIRKLNEETANGRGNVKKIHAAYIEFKNLDKPQNHAADYERAIGLMDWEVDEKIQLSVNDWECYVQDNWNWKRSFKMSHESYSR
jgi:hypothetical protein